VVSDEGVAGVAVAGLGAGAPGPPGPRGTSVLTGAAFDWLPGRKAGSELRMSSFLCAKALRWGSCVSRMSFELGTYNAPEMFRLARGIAGAREH
jgi:hypothetical protein